MEPDGDADKYLYQAEIILIATPFYPALFIHKS